MPQKQNMAISELSKQTNVPVSTIKFYIREGLLSKPIKTSGTRGYYTSKHLARLQIIKKLQKEGVSLNKVNEIVQMMDSTEKRDQREGSHNHTNNRSDIINSAINLFREKGYDTVTIADIVDTVGIGCSTFYKQFKNKKDLFSECIKKIISDEEVQTDVATIDDAQSMTTIFEKDAEASLKQDPLWRDMIKILRVAALNDPDEFADTLEEAIQQKINLFKNRIEKGIKLGYFRDANKTLLAVMGLGIQEACSEYFSKPEFTEDVRRKISEEVTDIILHGILKK